MLLKWFYFPLRKSELSQAFSEHFPGISLAEMLSNFSLPVSLGELKEVFSDEVHEASAETCLLPFSVLSPLKNCAEAASNILYVCYILITAQAGTVILNTVNM